MPAVFLNHDFVQGMAHRADLAPVAVALQDAQQRLGAEPFRVHPELSSQDTGAGTFIQWAHRSGSDKDARRTLAELLLRLLSGPFVTDLPVSSSFEALEASPPLPEEPSWRREAVQHLAQHALTVEGVLPWVLSFDPRSDLREPLYRLASGDAVAEVENFRQLADLTARLDALATTGLAGALAVLEAAGRHASRLVILDRARDSARKWTLDCSEAMLFKALVQLEAYATALDDGLSRELAAEHYHKTSGIEMSRESGAVGRSPTLKRQREINVPGHGTQYFDMHAKPGARTRIHVWTALVDGRHVVFVGHCGDHLALGKR
ncbi:hypothetical protein [Polyangium aurulentum]|uniref:hypothetical protein n=1 Tax=Polyangium aurulentum TaxID=2567896 RepID=UPI0010AED41C|nr:hypothetical protein [Polyangium aurulentum]UQA62968.1 hypothetical protein E8A73_021925 [Polyangium aurulentum]